MPCLDLILICIMIKHLYSYEEYVHSDILDRRLPRPFHAYTYSCSMLHTTNVTTSASTAFSPYASFNSGGADRFFVAHAHYDSSLGLLTILRVSDIRGYVLRTRTFPNLPDFFFTE